MAYSIYTGLLTGYVQYFNLSRTGVYVFDRVLSVVCLILVGTFFHARHNHDV